MFSIRFQTMKAAKRSMDFKINRRSNSNSTINGDNNSSTRLMMKPSLPSFYTANQNYYQLLQQTNNLMRSLDLSFTLPPSKNGQLKCISMSQLASQHSMQLTEETYALLLHNFKHLSTSDLPHVKSLMKPFILASSHTNNQDQENSDVSKVKDYVCSTIASRKTARSNVTLSKGEGTFIPLNLNESSRFIL